MSDLVSYTNPQSRGRIVHWMLEELSEPYQTVWLDYGSTMKAPEYLAVNPMGKVPALRDGDTVVTESAAICAYLADRFPQPGLAPPPTWCSARHWAGAGCSAPSTSGLPSKPMWRSCSSARRRDGRMR
jgi:glutathione S-transferase